VNIYCMEWVNMNPRNLTRLKIVNDMTPLFEDFSTLNPAFVDFFYNYEDRRLVFAALHFMADNELERLLGINPIMHDYLDNLQCTNELLNDTVHFYSYDEGKQGDAEEHADHMMSTLLSVQNHLALGAEMGLEGRRMGVYDAMVGVFSITIDVRIVRAAKELNTWLLDITYPYQDNKRMLEEVSTRIEELSEKYGFEFNERLTPPLIVNEVMNWDEGTLRGLYIELKMHFEHKL